MVAGDDEGAQVFVGGAAAIMGSLKEEGGFTALTGPELKLLVGWIDDDWTVAEKGVRGTAEEGTALGGGPEKTVPSPRPTSLRGAVLPLKNSAAVREGSTEGAGGYMSDWKESACGRQVSWHDRSE